MWFSGLARVRAGERLDAAHAGGNARIARRRRSARYRRCAGHACRRRARPTSRACCRPAALAHRDDAHLVAVFLAEQRARAGRARIVERHQPRGDGRILQHEIVGDVLDLLDLLAPSSAWDARSRSAAGRARPASPSARRDRRAPGAAPRAAGASPNGCARIARTPRMIDLERERRADLQRALLDRDRVREQVAGLPSACR